MRVLFREGVTTVTANSTAIVGANPKRCRLTIWPLSATPVYVRAMSPAVASQGAAVVNGNVPVVFGSGPAYDDDGEPITTFADAIQGIVAAGTANVYYVEEFYGP